MASKEEKCSSDQRRSRKLSRESRERTRVHSEENSSVLYNNERSESVSHFRFFKYHETHLKSVLLLNNSTFGVGSAEGSTYDCLNFLRRDDVGDVGRGNLRKKKFENAISSTLSTPSTLHTFCEVESLIESYYSPWKEEACNRS